jgi:FkbH-like protein
MSAAPTIFLLNVTDDRVRAAPSPRRADLMCLVEPTGLTRIHLQIHRNYAFELVGSVLPPFLWLAGMKPVIAYGAYDDSLSFAQVDPAAVQIISLDFERYGEQAQTSNFSDWFTSRLENLRAKTEKPIVVSDWPSEESNARQFNLMLEKIADRVPSVFVWNTGEIFRNMRAEFFDERFARTKGTRLSDGACIELARNLGLVRLPSALRPRIKAVVVDLDNTLYDGVLGEDGIEGIRITEHHAAIHKELLRLREEGVFLGALSKNDERDFAQLCLRRSDFLLKPEHFSASSIGWQSKAEGLTRIADDLHIAADSILVVDDNPGEIEQIRAVHANTHLLYPRSAAQTLFWLRHYPALNGYRTNSSTTLRLNDLEASRQRDLLRATTSGADYLREMQIELTYALNPMSQRRRLAELSQKTNQFNTGLQRFSEVQVARRLETQDHCTISVSMSDRFCASGIIGAIFARLDGDCLVIDEVCISCRALGRNVESPMIALALAPVIERYGLRYVVFKFREGPRNLPARMWLTSFTGTQDIANEGAVIGVWEAIPQLHKHLTAPIANKWEHVTA